MRQPGRVGSGDLAVFHRSADVPGHAPQRNGHAALDGALVDNVPLSAVAECRRPLVLLSQHERALPAGGREVYACPSELVPVSAWDFSSPEKVVKTFELGLRDGARFREDWAA